MENLAEISSFIIPLIIAITMHEAAHGFVAYKCGDNTAKAMGRVSFDPIKHIDLFGTFLLPAFLYLSHAPFLLGWAKPVPVNFNRLNNPRRDTILVAVAGPLTNVILAYISALLTHIDIFISPEQAPWTFANLYLSVKINIVLAVFNMLPILPLDGGRVLNSLLPTKIAYRHAKSEPYGMIIIILLFMLPSLKFSYYFIWLPADALRDIILHLAGIG